MAAKKIHAIYTDDDLLMQAVTQTRAANYHISEVFTPFPVHGLDHALGLAPTRLAITSFLYGLVGLAVAMLMMNYMMIDDWPQNIGGKPSFTFYQNMPTFIPIMFELTVFFAGHLMVITFYMRSKLWPFRKAENPDIRTTDAHFLMEVDADNHDIQKLSKFLYDTGASEISLIENDQEH
ncbi:DUF3341 domain-containing protein [Aequorivita capsosiphonis]|uniref:DUF3341 domain-containing protein n=1 Tax=Aequorivita capsosiphonis TaxID=487317 RepID=UPI00041A4699|nr:DUF3341 domain-containing protein [Aequorivita capsosiphonis]